MREMTQSEKVSKSLTGKVGKDARRWKGEDAGYVAKHMWIYKYYGKASHCEIDIRHQGKRFCWANISRTYKRDILDWIQLCYSCHAILDKYKFDINKLRSIYASN